MTLDILTEKLEDIPEAMVHFSNKTLNVDGQDASNVWNLLSQDW